MPPKKRRRHESESSVPVDVSGDAAESKRLKEEATDRELAGGVGYAELKEGEVKPEPVVHRPGELAVHCLDVGQGDCTLIITPGGKQIMIDCGTSSVDAIAKTKLIAHTVQSIFASKQIDILILTHPDEDHHNKIIEVLGEGDYRVDLFFQSRSPDKSLSGNLPRFMTGDDAKVKILRAFCRPVDGVAEVRLECRDKTVRAEELRSDFGGVEILGKSIRILKEDACEISILVSNVLKQRLSGKVKGDISMNNGDGEGSNCGSIVTLVEANDERLLFCGDATMGTEMVLEEWHGKRIKELDFLRVAHHGSGATSSRPTFVALVKPRNMVISSGQRESAYGHPRWSAIRRFLNNTEKKNLLKAPVELVFWNECEPGESDLGAIVAPKGHEEDVWTMLKEEVTDSGKVYSYHSRFPIYGTPYRYVVPRRSAETETEI